MWGKIFFLKHNRGEKNQKRKNIHPKNIPPPKKSEKIRAPLQQKKPSPLP